MIKCVFTNKFLYLPKDNGWKRKEIGPRRLIQQ